MIGKSTNRSWIVTWGSWITGIGLILLAVQCLVYSGAADGYGVSPVDERGKAYLLATGMRDLSLGLMTLYLLFNYRACLAIFFLIMTIVPVADTLIVSRYGNSLINLGPHVIGLIGLLIISYFAYREKGREKGKRETDRSSNH